MCRRASSSGCGISSGSSAICRSRSAMPCVSALKVSGLNVCNDLNHSPTGPTSCRIARKCCKDVRTCSCSDQVRRIFPARSPRELNVRTLKVAFHKGRASVADFQPGVASKKGRNTCPASRGILARRYQRRGSRESSRHWRAIALCSLPSCMLPISSCAVS